MIVPNNAQYQYNGAYMNMNMNAPQPQNNKPLSIRIYSQKTTKNKSFLDMHNYLKAMGIKNNEFMLTLVDPDLDGVNPYDPMLSMLYKQKILRECMCNYWYFLREVVRIPAAGGYRKYELHRGNLAYNFCASLNFNIFFELPRQKGKTTAIVIRHLYIYNFGCTNANMAFLHKNMEGSKDNLRQLKDIRDSLPPYLILKERLLPDGKIDKGKNNETGIVNPYNNNLIKTYASATNKSKAASLLRGKTVQLIYYDEFAFMPYNNIVYLNAAPAFQTACDNARKAGMPYGITMSTTPGFLTSPEGQYAYKFLSDSNIFSETWYDKSYAELTNIINSNPISNFVYIRYTYQQLGESEQWFRDICKNMSGSWTDIRREVLLEWAAGNENSPFKEEDLETIKTLVREPINVCYLLGKYRFETYWQTNTNMYPPIIGVDVSAGYKHDSSTITIIDSNTTKVLGCMNCNYIPISDLARCIEFIVKNWMPNAIVNVERNGGFGSSCIAKLIKLGLRNNLYYEIKDVEVEERQDGIHAYKQKVRTKVYGLNSTKSIRKNLIDILIERVENHKDKFMSPIIYNELLGMEIKRNGKVEHSDTTHDDQIFGLLMALYVWYEGTNLAERYGIKKTTIKTDDEVDEIVDYFDGTVEVVGVFNTNTNEISEEIEKDLADAQKARGVDIDEFLNRQREQEQEQLRQLFNTPLGEKAYRSYYKIPTNVPINRNVSAAGNAGYVIPDAVFEAFSNPTTSDYTVYNNNENIFVAPSNRIDLLEDEEYKYHEHFNF